MELIGFQSLMQVLVIIQMQLKKGKIYLLKHLMAKTTLLVVFGKINYYINLFKLI